MTRFWLVRHGSHDWLGKSLIGRAPGMPLNAAGQHQAELLATALGDLPMAAIYSSPMKRALETAGPLAKALAVHIEVQPELDEIDFGTWTQLPFAELSKDPRWHHWNATRGKGRAPGGESMRAVQRRIVRGLQRLACTHPGEDVALFSHGDVVKAALCWYLNISLDSIHMFSVEPGAVAVLELFANTAALRALKQTEDLSVNTCCTIQDAFPKWIWTAEGTRKHIPIDAACSVNLSLAEANQQP